MQKRSMITIGVIFGIFIFSILAVLARQGVVIKSRNKETISVLEEWKVHGKPVVVKKVLKEDVPLVSRVTFQVADLQMLKAYVNRNTVRKLKEGQSVCLDVQAKSVLGHITSISLAQDIDTGLFVVEAKLEKPLEQVLSKIILYVQIGQMQGIINVDSQLLFTERDDRFLWIVQDGKAVRRKVLIVENGLSGDTIQEGLVEGDMLVVEGHTILKEGDIVRIVQNMNNEGAQL